MRYTFNSEKRTNDHNSFPVATGTINRGYW